MPASTSSVPAPARVLLADDEPHIRRILITVLETARFHVTAVRDGLAALDQLRADHTYDIVLLDLMMPGASGLEVLAGVRAMAHREGIPVIILTAKGQEADRAEAFRLGANDFITKPFSPRKLLVRIDELLVSS